MYNFIKKTAVDKPKLTLAIFLLTAVLSVTLIGGLKRDPTPYLLPPEHESRVNLSKLRDNYTGTGDGIIILLETENTVFKESTLRRIKRLTEAFENINIITPKDMKKIYLMGEKTGGETGKLLKEFSSQKINEESWEFFTEILESAKSEYPNDKTLNDFISRMLVKINPVKEITSLSNTDNILEKNGGIDVNPIYEDIPSGKNEIEQIRKNVHGNSLFKDILITPDDKFTTIVIELGIKEDRIESRFSVYQKIKKILSDIPGNEKYYIAGMPVTSAAMGITMKEDTARLFPIVILIVITTLFLIFRNIKGILIPLSVVILSLIITLAIKVIFNIPLNIITTTLPVFILSIGVADGIHMFSEYRDQIQKGLDKIEAVQETLRNLTLPVMMTSFTTAAAFYSISFTEIVQLKHFGIFVAVGTIIAMIFSLFFIPALLMVTPERMLKKEVGESKIEKKYSKALVYFTNTIIKNPYITVLSALAVLIISAFGSTKVIVNNNNVKYFMEESEIYLSAERLNKKASGSSVLNYLVEIRTKESEPFKNYNNLIIIDKFTNFIKEQKHVGKVLGLTELVKRINYVLNNEKVIPKPKEGDRDGRKIISQLLLLYENGGGDVLTDYTDSNYRVLNIPVILKTNSSKEMFELNGIVREYAKRNFTSNMTLKVSGSANVAIAATEEIVSGQIVSLIASVLIVLFMLLITFRSFYFSLIALIPLVMTIAINFGVMGFLNISLDIGTAVISSIVIGIGVDYGIHYISRYRSNRNYGMDLKKALEETARHSGKAIVSNAVTVALGFCALLFSILTPLVVMGWMICLTMIVSSICTMVLIPAILSIVELSKQKSAQSFIKGKLAYQKIK